LNQYAETYIGMVGERFRYLGQIYHPICQMHDFE